MPRVRFLADFDFSPAAKGGRVTVAYKTGVVANVTRECAVLASSLGRIEDVTARADSLAFADSPEVSANGK